MKNGNSEENFKIKLNDLKITIRKKKLREHFKETIESIT